MSVSLVCPGCRGPILRALGDWSCSGCGRRIRSIRGIPDLRVAEDGYLSSHEDWDLAMSLDRTYDRLDFRGLLDFYFDLAGDVPVDRRSEQVAHILSAPGRARQWVEALGPGLAQGAILDLGCGSGSFLVAGAARGRPAVGVDIAMRWLILARKRLEEEGREDALLVCACAEHLPFPDGSFAGIVGGDVIEHVGDAGATLDEAHRVLQAEGRLVLATPNRYSLAPEPHVGLWGVGFLPRRWMCRYVAWRRKGDFRAVHTRGFGEWKRMMRVSPFPYAEVASPPLPDESLAGFSPLKTLLAKAHNAVLAWAPGRALACRFGPLLRIEARKEAEESDRAPTPAIRRPSRLPGARRSAVPPR